MPLYMDRHYAKEATRQAIELAHEQDLKIQQQYDVKFLTYWFDESRKTTFCLVEAPNQALVHKVHNLAHGDVPHEIIEVDEASVSLFLGRINDPVNKATGHTEHCDAAFRVIMFTDLVDSTALTSKLGDDEAMFLLRIHNSFIRNAIRAHQGNEIKHTGDGLMITFLNADNALQCANAIQQAFASYNQECPEVELHVRIGLSAGEPVEENSDFFGRAVQLAARTCDAAKANEILFTSEVYDNLSDNKLCVFKDNLLFKGVDKPIPVYSL